MAARTRAGQDGGVLRGRGTSWILVDGSHEGCHYKNIPSLMLSHVVAPLVGARFQSPTGYPVSTIVQVYIAVSQFPPHRNDGHGIQRITTMDARPIGPALTCTGLSLVLRKC